MAIDLSGKEIITKCEVFGAPNIYAQYSSIIPIPVNSIGSVIYSELTNDNTEYHLVEFVINNIKLYARLAPTIFHILDT